MEDAEFLNYCELHADTPRAGFVGGHIKRLYQLAGEPEPDVDDDRIYSCHHADELARQARSRFEAAER